MCYNDGMPRIGQIGGSKVRGTLLSYRIRVELGDLVIEGDVVRYSIGIF